MSDHPETQMIIASVSDLETSTFSQGQANAQIDAEIAEKGGFRTKTN